MRVRRREPQKRTSIPKVYQRQFARRLRRYLETEGTRRTEHQRQLGQHRPDDIAVTLVELRDERGITPRTVNAYMLAERFPGAYDMRELALFCGVTVEDLMSDIPNLYAAPKGSVPT